MFILFLFIILGVFFFGLGLITFFDSALLAFGNVLFLSGILLIIGVRRTFYFFARPAKIRGSCLFFFGIVLILIKYSFIGFAIEFLGILSLFGDFFGVIVTFLRSLPVIGPLLSNPYIAPVSILEHREILKLDSRWFLWLRMCV